MLQAPCRLQRLFLLSNSTRALYSTEGSKNKSNMAMNSRRSSWFADDWFQEFDQMAKDNEGKGGHFYRSSTSTSLKLGPDNKFEMKRTWSGNSSDEQKYGPSGKGVETAEGEWKYVDEQGKQGHIELKGEKKRVWEPAKGEKEEIEDKQWSHSLPSNSFQDSLTWWNGAPTYQRKQLK